MPKDRPVADKDKKDKHDKLAEAQQEALFREVDEELRHEQLHKLWSKYGGWAIGAAVLIVLVVAGYQGWQAWRANVRANEAAAYEQAVALAESGNLAEAADALAALGADASTGYRSLAQLRRAAILSTQGDAKGAAEAYLALAQDGKADPAYRDLARVLHVMNAMDLPGSDAEGLKSVVAPLDTPDNPYRFSAREALGLLALKQGDTATARDVFAQLADDPNAPRGMRARAQELTAQLGGPTETGQAGTGETAEAGAAAPATE